MPYLAQHEALLRRLYVGEDRELSATMTYMKDHYPTRKHPAFVLPPLPDTPNST